MSSNHPRSTFNSMIQSEFRRFTIGTNSLSDFNATTESHLQSLRVRGYSEQFLQRQLKHKGENQLEYNTRHNIYLQQVLDLPKGPKKNKEPPMIFKTTANPRLTRLNISSCLEVPLALFTEPCARDIFNSRNPILCLQRPENIGDIITRSAYCNNIDTAILNGSITPANHLSILLANNNST